MNEFHAKMQQLRAEYRLVVAADLRQLQQLAVELRGGEQDRAALERMAALLHKIAGGAGVFGLMQLSEQCRGLELDLNDWLVAPLAQDYAAALPEFRAGLARLALNPDEPQQ
jgi:HPt (histidine-containing phosphotransfer) domain-containing protein